MSWVTKPAVVLALILTTAVASRAATAVDIQTVHGTLRELQTRQTLQWDIETYDLSKYTFTNRVLISARAMNHSFPEIVLNVRYANAPDELLSSYIHEQLHWYLRNHNPERMEGIRAS